MWMLALSSGASFMVLVIILLVICTTLQRKRDFCRRCTLTKRFSWLLSPWQFYETIIAAHFPPHHPHSSTTVTEPIYQRMNRHFSANGPKQPTVITNDTAAPDESMSMDPSMLAFGPRNMLMNAELTRVVVKEIKDITIRAKEVSHVVQTEEATRAQLLQNQAHANKENAGLQRLAAATREELMFYDGALRETTATVQKDIIVPTTAVVVPDTDETMDETPSGPFLSLLEIRKNHAQRTLRLTALKKTLKLLVARIPEQGMEAKAANARIKQLERDLAKDQAVLDEMEADEKKENDALEQDKARGDALAAELVKRMESLNHVNNELEEAVRVVFVVLCLLFGEWLTLRSNDLLLWVDCSARTRCIV
jgi:hypothetical protein